MMAERLKRRKRNDPEQPMGGPTGFNQPMKLEGLANYLAFKALRQKEVEERRRAFGPEPKLPRSVKPPRIR